jgi:hypothetical protein
MLMGTKTKIFYCRDCGTLLKEDLGLHKLYFETFTGDKVENQVRMLACPKQRWFHVTKHAPRLVSFDYAIEYVQS